MNEKIYSNDDIDRILRRAINKNSSHTNGVTESDLFRIASELNISREQVLHALKEDKELAGYEEARKMWLDKKKTGFREHLAAFVIVNGFLTAVNILTLGTVSWVFYPIFGWGIGLAFDFYESFYPSEDKIDAGARKMMKTNKWKNLFSNIGSKILEELQRK